MVNLGVKFFCFTVTLFKFIIEHKVFMIRKKNTNPQGLLVSSFIISKMILAFMMEILTLAPQYTTFGTQNYIFDSTKKEVPCSLNVIIEGQQKQCIMSNISKFYNKISLSLPFFSTFFYFANWLLILVIFCSLLTSCCKENDVTICFY